jgi:hypothetical protein
MRRVVEWGSFKGIMVGRDPVLICDLQYADDTLCIGEASVENLWTLKAIFRGFEMASGLKVNFWKSGLSGVNVSNVFLEMACSFLNCKRGSIPFKYLGLHIGANPRREVTWEPLLDHLRKRLLSWRNKHISLGGRIVMINAVLNSIPIFYLSYYKMPNKVWKKVVRIQREFLWGGPKGGKRISWVKWSLICMERKHGGLGVRDIRLVNISLLVKWRWRLLLPGRSLWKDVVIAKYGSHMLQHVEWANFSTPSNVSSWWKNIVNLEKVVPGKNWLMEAIKRKVGNGEETLFWYSKWASEAPLALLYPRLFILSNYKDCKVSDIVSRNGNSLEWNFVWRRTLFQWEEDLARGLRDLLEEVVLSVEEDCWWWLPEEEGVFSVKSAYNVLIKDLRTEEVVRGDLLEVFDHLWESPAPSKVIAFSWQLLYDRIPTRFNLQVRGIMAMDRPWECLGCVGRLETSLHLFLHCPCAMKIWRDIFKWLGVEVVIPPSVESLFEVFRGLGRNSKIRKGYMLIWHVTLWVIWKARNNAIFSSGYFLPNVIVEEIKVLSWKWSLGRLRITPCLFYEWNWDPGECLRS